MPLRSPAHPRPTAVKHLEHRSDACKNASTLWREAQVLVSDGGLVVDAADLLEVIEQVMRYFYGLGVHGAKNKALTGCPWHHFLPK
jgi:hypothetical protein